MSKNIKTRIQHKHDIEANWINAVNFAPLAGELIIYDPDDTHALARLKIGDGKTFVNDLSFVDENLIEILANKEPLGASETALASAQTYTDTEINKLISSGITDPDANTASQFYFKYSID